VATFYPHRAEKEASDAISLRKSLFYEQNEKNLKPWTRGFDLFTLPFALQHPVAL